MKKLFDYRVLLIVWFSIGSLISGYLYIYPMREKDSRKTLKGISDRSSFDDIWTYETYSYDDFTIANTIILITVVGAFLIGGIGYILSKKSNS